MIPKTGNFNLKDNDRSGTPRKFNDDELENCSMKIRFKRKKNWQTCNFAARCLATYCKRNTEHNLCIRMGSPATCGIFSRPDFVRLIFFWSLQLSELTIVGETLQFRKKYPKIY